MRIERHSYDVVVIGAGGAGLRAAIEARSRGLRTAIVCKSLFGKAHTVMAEGGIAASMGNVNSKDNWQVHFRDTMRGGKFLNSWRMAELHAKEAPRAGLGAGDLRRAVRPHPRGQDLPAQLRRPRVPPARARRRPHGPRADPHAAAEDRLPAAGGPRESGDYEARIKVFAECTITELLKDGDAIAGAFGYWRESGRFVVFDAPTVILATGGIGKSFKVTSNSWEYTGDGHALALKAGGTLAQHGVHPVPPDGHGLAAKRQGHPRHGVRTRRWRRPHQLRGQRFMFDYVPEVFRKQYAETEEEADRWYTDADNNRRPPELLPRDEVARAINSEVKAGRGSPHGGVFLDVSKRLPAEVIRKKLPVDVAPVQGARRRRHHRRGDGGRSDLPLRDGRGRGRPRHGGGARTGPVRGRRGRPAACTARTGSAATRCPTCWCSAGGPVTARPTTSSRWAAYVPKVDEASVDAAAAQALAPVPDGGRREPLHAAPGAAAVDERPGRDHPHSDGGRRGARPAAGPQAARAAGDRRGAPPVQPGLAPGPRPARTCCWSPSAWPGQRWSARSRAAVTPATTSPGMNPEWRKVNLSARWRTTVPQGAGQRHPSAHPADAARPARAVRRGRAVEVPDRRELSHCTPPHRSQWLQRVRLPTEEALMGYDGPLPGLARRRHRRRTQGLRRRGQRGRGRPRRHPSAPGHRGARPGGPVELQGRQVRLVQRRGQRPAAADVHDPDEHVHRGRDHDGDAACGRSR